MSVTEKHTLYGVQAGAVIIGGITDSNLGVDTTILSEANSGEVYSRQQNVVAQQHPISFTTNNIAAALDVVSVVAGVSIGGLSGGLGLYAHKYAAEGTRSAGSTHRKYTYNAGILVPRRLRGDHQGNMTLDVDAVITYDAVNAPVVVTDSVALPAGLADGGRFTIGPQTFESITLDHVRSWELDFGITVEAEAADSDIYDTQVSISEVAPMLTLTGIDPTWLKSDRIPLAGLACTHTNTAFYLRKRTAGGTFVVDGTAEHIKFTAEGLGTITTAFQAGRTGAGTCVFQLPMHYDGTNAPITVATTAAIT